MTKSRCIVLEEEGFGKTVMLIDENKYQQLAYQIIARNLPLLFPKILIKSLEKYLDRVEFL